jgi:hypothetical protein
VDATIMLAAMSNLKNPETSHTNQGSRAIEENSDFHSQRGLLFRMSNPSRRGSGGDHA